MEKIELVFVPGPGMGHIVSMVEMAKLLVNHEERLSITVLLMKLTSESQVKEYTDSLSASTTTSARIRFIDLPGEEPNSNADPCTTLAFVRRQKPHVKDAIFMLKKSSLDSPLLVGLVLDMFCASMVDVANELCIPSYIYFTSCAAFLGCCFHIQVLHDEHKVDTSQFSGTDRELPIPSLVNPLPARVFPPLALTKDSLPDFLESGRRFRETHGIIVNTFSELEPHAINSLSDGRTPPIYPVGPILNQKSNSHVVGSDVSSKCHDIVEWLDHQPRSSVLFLCFGSLGCFGADQTKEIACALERSGHRFLWSLRKPPKQSMTEAPSDYADPQEVLPEGFVDRTADIGKIVGWAPQMDILAHPAIGGFMSHCGWNSILESIWFGVPVAAWSMYAEQQFNAFYMVVELGLAIEIKMDYRMDFKSSNQTVVSAIEIERAIRCLMVRDSEQRKKVKEMSMKSREVMMNGGSFYSSLSRLIGDMAENHGLKRLN